MFVMLKKEGVEAGYVSLSLSLGMLVDLGLRFIVAYVNFKRIFGRRCNCPLSPVCL
jgi:hypothetical protein